MPPSSKPRTATCTGCNKAFLVEKMSGRIPDRCPPCAAEYVRARNRERQYRWRETHPEKWKAVQARNNAKRMADPVQRRLKREREARRLYGLGPDELQRLVESQGGRCAICGYVPPASDDSRPLPRGQASTRLHVDHCHDTDRVRGLLCGKCNTMIGLAGEDPQILLKAIAYLEKKG